VDPAHYRRGVPSAEQADDGHDRPEPPGIERRGIAELHRLLPGGAVVGQAEPDHQRRRRAFLAALRHAGALWRRCAFLGHPPWPPAMMSSSMAQIMFRISSR